MRLPILKSIHKARATLCLTSSRGYGRRGVGSYRVIYSIEGSPRSPKAIVRAIKHPSTAY